MASTRGARWDTTVEEVTLRGPQEEDTTRFLRPASMTNRPEGLGEHQANPGRLHQGATLTTFGSRPGAEIPTMGSVNRILDSIATLKTTA